MRTYTNARHQPHVRTPHVHDNDNDDNNDRLCMYDLFRVAYVRSNVYVHRIQLKIIINAIKANNTTCHLMNSLISKTSRISHAGEHTTTERPNDDNDQKRCGEWQTVDGPYHTRVWLGIMSRWLDVCRVYKLCMVLYTDSSSSTIYANVCAVCVRECFARVRGKFQD